MHNREVKYPHAPALAVQPGLPVSSTVARKRDFRCSSYRVRSRSYTASGGLTVRSLTPTVPKHAIGQTPCFPRSFSCLRTTSLGFTAIADQLEIFLPRDLFFRQVSVSSLHEPVCPIARAGQQPFVLDRISLVRNLPGALVSSSFLSRSANYAQEYSGGSGSTFIHALTKSMVWGFWSA